MSALTVARSGMNERTFVNAGTAVLVSAADRMYNAVLSVPWDGHGPLFVQYEDYGQRYLAVVPLHSVKEVRVFEGRVKVELAE